MRVFPTTKFGQLCKMTVSTTVCGERPDESQREGQMVLCVNTVCPPCHGPVQADLVRFSLFACRPDLSQVGDEKQGDTQRLWHFPGNSQQAN